MEKVIVINKKETDPQLWNALQFVLKAKSKDSIKPVFFGVYFSENFEIVCTDSRRLHLIKGVDVQQFIEFKEIEVNKIYEIEKTSTCIILKSEIDGNFPNHKAVIPDYANDTNFKIMGKVTCYDRLKGIFVGKSQYLSGKCFNCDFIMDIFTKYGEFDIFANPDKYMSAVLWEDKTNENIIFQAVIMPIMCKNEYEED